MSNMIRRNAMEPKEKSLSMSNQGTDTFLELILLSAAGREMTASQKRLIDYLTERREVNWNAPGTASFDVVDMPWSKETLREDVTFMLEVIGRAEKPEISGRLGYRPDMRIVTPWLRQFGQMIHGLDKDYIYGPEEREIIKAGLPSIYAVLSGNDSGAKRRLLYYLDWYMDPYYKNDLSILYEPLKEMLQDVVIKENLDDVKEEALHLLGAYTDAPYEILEENINEVPRQFLPEVKSLIKTGEPERIELTGTLMQRIEEAVRLVLSEVSPEEVDRFRELYEAAGIRLLPSAINFFKEYGGAFRNSYIELNEPRFNQDIFLDCYGIPYIRYSGANPKGVFQEQLRELGWAANSIGDVREFAGQEVCPVAEIGYYYQPDVYIGEDGTLYCVYEYKDEIGIFHSPAEILADQLGNIYPVAVYRRK